MAHLCNENSENYCVSVYFKKYKSKVQTSLFPCTMMYTVPVFDLVFPIQTGVSPQSELKSEVLLSINEGYSINSKIHMYTNGSAEKISRQAASSVFSRFFKLRESLSLNSGIILTKKGF